MIVCTKGNINQFIKGDAILKKLILIAVVKMVFAGCSGGSKDINGFVEHFQQNGFIVDQEEFNEGFYKEIKVDTKYEEPCCQFLTRTMNLSLK